MNEIYIYLNEDGTIVGWGDGYSENAIVVEYQPDSPFFSDYMSYKYVDGEFISDIDGVREAEARMQLIKDKEEAKVFLDESRIAVDRHKDELALGIPTTLTDEEYKDILRQRIVKATLLQEG